MIQLTIKKRKYACASAIESITSNCSLLMILLCIFYVEYSVLLLKTCFQRCYLTLCLAGDVYLLKYYSCILSRYSEMVAYYCFTACTNFNTDCKLQPFMLTFYRPHSSFKRIMREK